jgi:hypothetical protein
MDGKNAEAQRTQRVAESFSSAFLCASAFSLFIRVHLCLSVVAFLQASPANFNAFWIKGSLM